MDSQALLDFWPREWNDSSLLLSGDPFDLLFNEAFNDPPLQDFGLLAPPTSLDAPVPSTVDDLNLGDIPAPNPSEDGAGGLETSQAVLDQLIALLAAGGDAQPDPLNEGEQAATELTGNQVRESVQLPVSGAFASNIGAANGPSQTSASLSSPFSDEPEAFTPSELPLPAAAEVGATEFTPIVSSTPDTTPSASSNQTTPSPDAAYSSATTPEPVESRLGLSLPRPPIVDTENTERPKIISLFETPEKMQEKGQECFTTFMTEEGWTTKKCQEMSEFATQFNASSIRELKYGLKLRRPDGSTVANNDRILDAFISVLDVTYVQVWKDMGGKDDLAAEKEAWGSDLAHPPADVKSRLPKFDQEGNLLYIPRPEVWYQNEKKMKQDIKYGELRKEGPPPYIEYIQGAPRRLKRQRPGNDSTSPSGRNTGEGKRAKKRRNVPQPHSPAPTTSAGPSALNMMAGPLSGSPPAQPQTPDGMFALSEPVLDPNTGLIFLPWTDPRAQIQHNILAQLSVDAGLSAPPIPLLVPMNLPTPGISTPAAIILDGVQPQPGFSHEPHFNPTAQELPPQHNNSA